MNRILMKWVVLCMGLCFMASCAKEKSGFVTIYPDGGQAKVVRLQVVNDRIIRVQATSEEALPQKQSLMVVPQTASVDYDVQEDAEMGSCHAKVGTDAHVGHRDQNAVHRLCITSEDFTQFLLYQSFYFTLTRCFHIVFLFFGAKILKYFYLCVVNPKINMYE